MDAAAGTRARLGVDAAGRLRGGFRGRRGGMKTPREPEDGEDVVRSPTGVAVAVAVGALVAEVDVTRGEPMRTPET